MNKSESIGKLAHALSKVQANLRPAIKDAKNPFFKSNYADLNSVWDSCRQLLSENGLSVAQLNQVAENGVIIETVLMHESGEWISGEMFLPINKPDAQSVGSAMTYGRRYGLSAIIGIVADEDDDGNQATRPPVKTTQAASVETKQRTPQTTESDTPMSPQQVAEIKKLKLQNKDNSPTDFSRLNWQSANRLIVELGGQSF